MTAQIAIKNEECIALASDSGVSLGRGKVYNSCCKLFQLSETHPVGIMNYGVPLLTGVSIETLIKLYRKDLSGKLLDSLDDYVNGFIAFIVNNNESFFPKEKIAEETSRNVLGYLDSDILPLFTEKIESSPDEPSDIVKAKILNDILDDLKLALKKEQKLPGKFDKLEFQEEKFNDMLIRECGFSEDFKINSYALRIKNILNMAFQKKCCMGECGGLVFAGFGEKEMHPQITNIEIYRVIKPAAGREAIIDYKKIDLGEFEDAIFPFAQAKAMVNLYLKGIDTSVNKYLEGLLDKFSDNVIKKIKRKISKTNYKNAFQKNVDIKKIVADEIETFNNKLFYYSNSNFIGPMRSMIFGLPREELANMAEMLIRLTSFRQRVSDEEQSVCEPIDVAVITKADGFVWQKRKETLTLK
jgi:hypothetical protein